MNSRHGVPVRWALARVEGRRLLAHPLFVLGMGTSTAALVLYDSDAFERAMMLSGDCFMLLGGAVWTFLVASLAASRERRDAAQDFYAGQPVTPRLRTEAALLSVGWAGLAGAVLIGVTAILVAGVDGELVVVEQAYALRPLELAQGPLYLVMAGAMGVLVGSWTRHVYAAVLGAFVLFLPPIALSPWLVFDDTVSRGFYGAVLPGAPVDLRLIGLAGLAALAAAGALARHDRRARVALLALVGVSAVVAGLALSSPAGSLASACGARAGESVVATRTGARAVQETSGNWNFESGDFTGWQTRSGGSGAWHVYADGTTPPNPADSDPQVPFSVPAPPEGRYAAVTDMCSAGARILYRDVRLDGRRELRFTLFYENPSGAFFSPTTLRFDRLEEPNQQLRVEILDPAAPVDSLAAGDVLATIFRTAPGDPGRLGPRTMSFDLSRWAGDTVRIRFAQVDNQGPLRAGVDDVALEAVRP